MHHKNDQYGDTHSETGSQNNFGEDENSGGHVVKYNNTPVVIRRNDNKIDLKLFVGQISKNWDEKEVTNFFSKFGDIMESQILKDKNGNSKGCAFVKFSSMTRAERAIEELTKTKVILPGANATIQIRWADGEPERLGMDPEMNFKLFVGSIPREATDQNLRDLFERFGKIEELHLMKEPDGITSRGSAFIKYALRESALLAIKNLHAQAYILNSDKPIEVRLAEKPKRMNQTGPAIQPSDQNKNIMNRQGGGAGGGGMGYHMPVAYNPMYGPQMVFYHYKTAEGVSYYYNPMTMVSTYEKPPQGSMVYNMFEPTTMAPTTTPYMDMSYSTPNPVHTGGTLNDLSDQNNSKKQGPAGANLFIFHLPNYWKDSDLFSLFRYYGNVLSARIMTEKGTGKSKGYGFVSYERQEDAQKAIESLNGYKVEGSKRLKVEVKKGEGEEGSVSSLGNNKFQAY